MVVAALRALLDAQREPARADALPAVGRRLQRAGEQERRWHVHGEIRRLHRGEEPAQLRLDQRRVLDDQGDAPRGQHPRQLLEDAAPQGGLQRGEGQRADEDVGLLPAEVVVQVLRRVADHLQARVVEPLLQQLRQSGSISSATRRASGPIRARTSAVWLPVPAPSSTTRPAAGTSAMSSMSRTAAREVGSTAPT